MIILLSPAKSLDFNCEFPKNISLSEPYFALEALQLVEVIQNYSVPDLMKLMGISQKLAELNFKRFQDFKLNSYHSKPCIFAYNGDVYDGMDIQNYNHQQLEFTNDNLRIISGLYGLLKPFDLIQPYRLEMSTNLANKNGKNLYLFWGNKITELLNKDTASDTIINLASQEYSSAIAPAKLNKNLINIQFKENTGGIYKDIGIYSKNARGIMANFIIQNYIKSPNDLKNFDLSGYKFCSKTSSKNEYIFVRD